MSFIEFGGRQDDKILDFSKMGLTSLDGCDKVAQFTLLLSGNKLESLDGITSVCRGYLDLSDNKLVSLEGIHKQIDTIQGRIYLGGNQIKSHVLGLLLIKHLQMVVLNVRIAFHKAAPHTPNPYNGLPWMRIINNYLPNRRGIEAVYDCQEEMLRFPSLDKFAQL